MSVYLSKILSLAIYPLTWVFILFIMSLILLLAKKYRSASGTLAFSLISFWIIAMPVTGQWLTYTLESQYPAQPADSYPQADVIILLGGGMAGSAEPVRPFPDLLDSADRVWFAAQLFNAQIAPTIIASGGTLSWHGVQQSEAQAMHQLLVQLGVDSHAIIDEDQSLTTYENAWHCFKLPEASNAKRILLVSSAAHLPRAMAVFQRVFPDAQLIAAPTDVRVIAVGDDLMDWLPQASGIGMLTEAWHEWVGLWIYRFKGWA
jgi:uncharacterized SAM-binding protein YcdF (DUF218 family)